MCPQAGRSEDTEGRKVPSQHRLPKVRQRDRSVSTGGRGTGSPNSLPSNPVSESLGHRGHLQAACWGTFPGASPLSSQLTQIQSIHLTSRQPPVRWSCLQAFHLVSDCHLRYCCCSFLEEGAVNRGHRRILPADPAPGPPLPFPHEAPSLCTPQTKANFLYTLRFP